MEHPYQPIPNYHEIILNELAELKQMVKTINDSKTDKNGINEEEYLSVKRTADFLDCTTAHVYVLKKRIPHINRGARLYFKKSDLMDYLDRGRSGPKW